MSGGRAAASVGGRIPLGEWKLVDRERERARLDSLLAESADGRGGALVILGDPGVGKTALLEDLLQRAGDRLILSARGFEAESQLAYAGLAQLLAPVLELRATLPAPRRAALESALGLGPPCPGDRFATYAAALGLLAEAAERMPAVVAVDDAHWLDASSLEALRFCARRIAADRIAIVLCGREPILDGSGATGLPELRLAGLDARATARLLEERVRVSVAPHVVATLHGATAGNPLALVELLNLLDDAQLQGTLPLPDLLPVGPAMRRTFGSQLARLPRATRQALLLAAADDSGELETLLRALRVRGLDPASLEPAEDAGLIALGDARVAFRHPLIRAVAYQSSSAPARRAAHAAVAEALRLAVHGRARRAWHLAAAALEPDERVAAELEAAADDASQRAAPEAAGDALEAAARLSPERERRVQRWLGAARAYHLAGAASPALRLLDQALGATEDPVARAEIQHTRAQVIGLRGAGADTCALLIGEARRVESVSRERAAAMLLEAATMSVLLGEPRESARLAQDAFAMAEETGGQLARIAGLVLGNAQILCGDAVTGYPLVAQARPLLHSSEPSVSGFVATSIIQAELWTGHYAEALRMHAELVRRIRAEGAITALPFALQLLGFAHLVCGEWRAAQAVCLESAELAATVGQPALGCMPLVVLGLAAGLQGDGATARAQLARARAIGEEFGLASTRTMAGWAEGEVELGVGAYDDAIAVLEPTAAGSLGAGLEEPGVAWWAQDLAEAYIRVGRDRDAVATLEILEAQAKRTGRSLAHAGAARCRGMLADDEDFAVHFERALGWHDGMAFPFERARTELCFGERLRRSRRRCEARDPLRRALAGFQALGAEPWAERARRELAATGERARKREPSTAARLTPQELQVAQLVAGGATNKEAASALFVTPKTIESHLNSVYRKLGIRSRVELPRVLADLDDAASRSM
jgi:DNA-binding CsgD family transcriptional regulator